MVLVGLVYGTIELLSTRGADGQGGYVFITMHVVTASAWAVFGCDLPPSKPHRTAYVAAPSCTEISPIVDSIASQQGNSQQGKQWSHGWTVTVLGAALLKASPSAAGRGFPLTLALCYHGTMMQLHHQPTPVGLLMHRA